MHKSMMMFSSDMAQHMDKIITVPAQYLQPTRTFRLHRKSTKDRQGDEGRSDGKSDQKPKPPTPPPREYPPMTTIGHAPEVLAAPPLPKKPSKPLPPPPPPRDRSRRGVTVEAEAAADKVHQTPPPFYSSSAQSEGDDESLIYEEAEDYYTDVVHVTASSNFTRHEGLNTGLTCT